MSKKHGNTFGLVYSTDPNFALPKEEEAQETLPIASQKLQVKLDTKHRAGKLVTLITGFIGTNDDLEALGKTLKTKCGTGGTAKDAQIIIQGDYKEKVILLLTQLGYAIKK